MTPAVQSFAIGVGSVVKISAVLGFVFGMYLLSLSHLALDVRLRLSHYETLFVSCGLYPYFCHAPSAVGHRVPPSPYCHHPCAAVLIETLTHHLQIVR